MAPQQVGVCLAGPCKSGLDQQQAAASGVINSFSKSNGDQTRRESHHKLIIKATGDNNEQYCTPPSAQTTMAGRCMSSAPSSLSSPSSMTSCGQISPQISASIGSALDNGNSRPTLVDLLVDSQLDWRQLISEANNREPLGRYLNESQIKRQEIIHELIQTERHHCLTLALMRQVYLAGLLKLNELRQRNSSTTATVTTTSATSASALSNGVAGQQPTAVKSSPTTNTKQANQQQQLIVCGSSSGPDNQHQASQSSLQLITGVNSGGEPIDIERLFPALEELIQAHELFFAHLRLRLVDCCSQSNQNRSNTNSNTNNNNNSVPLIGIIGPLGDLLIDQFKLAPDNSSGLAYSGARSSSSKRCQAGATMGLADGGCASSRKASPNTNGYKLLQAYAKFCGQHYESSRYYKQLMQCDKGFKQFIEQCNKKHPACKQRGIPECNLLVAQRLTKYPLLIEQLIKSSKDEPNDEEAKLKRALGECRSLLAELNSQLARKESFERLLDIYAQFSPKSYTIFYHKQAVKFTKHDLLQHKRLRQLVHTDDQIRVWSATRRKLFPVLCLILNDIIVFLRVEQQSISLAASFSTGSGSGIGASSSATTSCTMPPPPVTAQHLCSVGLDHSLGASAVTGTQLLTSTSNDQQQQQQTTVALVSCGASTISSGGGFHNGAHTARYYFANIDNKSSVISLSKLLVREKAVEEAEPRIYLISSSPKQPEMYELAFTSRRHQANFVTKLKSSIDKHNQTKMANLAAQLTTTNADSSYYLSNCSSSCCSLDVLITDEELEDADEEEEEEEEGEEENDNDEYDEHDELYDEDGEKRKKKDCNGKERDMDNKAVVKQGSDLYALCEGSQHNGLKVQVKTVGGSRNEGLAQAGGQKVPQETDSDIDSLKLDIEQDLVPAPLDLSDDDNSEENAGNDNEPQKADAEASASREDANTKAESPQPASGLSERARDSCDEFLVHSSSNGAGKCTGKQRMKANRRRRFQRPRQVSNQSSSSDSGNSSGTTNTLNEIDLNSVNSDEAGDTSAATGLARTPNSATNLALSMLSAKHGDEDEGLDSGRGQDDSSSSSSSSSTAERNDSMTMPASNEEAPINNTDSVQADRKQLNDSQSNVGRAVQAGQENSSLSLDRRQPKQHQPLDGRVADAAGASGGLIKVAASVLSKSNKQQRKLSTVSSISNQMKLIQKLRSVGLLDVATIGHGCTSDNNGEPTNSTYCSSTCCYQLGRNISNADTMLAHTDGLVASASLQSNQHHVVVLNTKRQRQQQLRRRSLFIPEQKLEELRNLRIQLDKDKQEWQEKFDRMQEQLLNERRELDLAREKLKRDKQQVENEREQLFRKLDLLKENGILLSPSHKVIITAPDRRLMQQHQRHNPACGSNQSIFTINHALQHQHHSLDTRSASINYYQHQQSLEQGASLHQQQLMHDPSWQQQQPNSASTLHLKVNQPPNPVGQQHQASSCQPMPAKVPLYLSQTSKSSRSQQVAQQQVIQQKPQRQSSNRIPFYGVLPGASFLVKRFGGTPSASLPPVSVTQLRISTGPAASDVQAQI